MYVSRYISYAKRVAAETGTEETAQYPQEKKTGWNKRCPKSKSKKGKEKKKHKRIKQLRGLGAADGPSGAAVGAESASTGV